MFYIDDYNSKAITNTPPKREQKEELAKAKAEINGKQLAVFWYVSGITIAHNFNAVKTLLSKYGYEVANEHDAAAAISDMLDKPKWVAFVKEFGEVIENTVDENVFKEFKAGDESSFVAALISAIGAVIGGSLSLASSAKQKQVAKENAKSQMLSAISAALTEKERRKTEAEISARQQKKSVMIIITVSVIIVGIIIAIVIYKRSKSKAIVN